MNATAAHFAACAVPAESWQREVAEIRLRDDAARAAGIKLEGRIPVHGLEFIGARNRFLVGCDDAAKKYGVESLLVWSTQ